MSDAEQFKQYFGKELKEYGNWREFNISTFETSYFDFDMFKFIDDFLPDLAEDESTQDGITKRYGQSATDLIVSMVNKEFLAFYG